MTPRFLGPPFPADLKSQPPKRSRKLTESFEVKQKKLTSVKRSKNRARKLFDMWEAGKNTGRLSNVYEEIGWFQDERTQFFAIPTAEKDS